MQVSSELRDKNWELQQEVEKHDAAASLALKRIKEQHDKMMLEESEAHKIEVERMTDRIFKLEDMVMNGREGGWGDLNGDALTDAGIEGEVHFCACLVSV